MPYILGFIAWLVLGTVIGLVLGPIMRRLHE